jgi:hypothetical protein
MEMTSHFGMESRYAERKERHHRKSRQLVVISYANINRQWNVESPVNRKRGKKREPDVEKALLMKSRMIDLQSLRIN